MEISTPVMTPAGTITSETTPGLTFVETTVALKTPTSMETIFLGTTYPETTTISTVSSKTTTSAVGELTLFVVTMATTEAADDVWGMNGTVFQMFMFI